MKTTSGQIVQLSRSEILSIQSDLALAYREYRIQANLKPYDLKTPHDKNSIYYSSLQEAISDTIGRIDVREATLHLLYHDEFKTNYKSKTIVALQKFINQWRLEQVNPPVFNVNDEKLSSTEILENVFSRISEMVKTSELQEAKMLFEATKDKLRGDNNKTQLAKLLYYYVKESEDTMFQLEILNIALGYFDNFEDAVLKSSITNVIGIAYSKNDDYQNGLTYFKKAINFALLANSSENYLNPLLNSWIVLRKRHEKEDIISIIALAKISVQEIFMDISEENKKRYYDSYFDNLIYANMMLNNKEIVNNLIKEYLQYSKSNNDLVGQAFVFEDLARYKGRAGYSSDLIWRSYLSKAFQLFIEAGEYKSAFECIIRHLLVMNNTGKHDLLVQTSEKLVRVLVKSIQDQDNNMRLYILWATYNLYKNSDLTALSLHQLKEFCYFSKLSGSDSEYVKGCVEYLQITSDYDDVNDVWNRNTLFNDAVAIIHRHLNNDMSISSEAIWWIQRGMINYFYKQKGFEVFYICGAQRYKNSNNMSSWYRTIFDLIDKLIRCGNYSAVVKYTNMIETENDSNFDLQIFSRLNYYKFLIYANTGRYIEASNYANAVADYMRMIDHQDLMKFEKLCDNARRQFYVTIDRNYSFENKVNELRQIFSGKKGKSEYQVWYERNNNMCLQFIKNFVGKKAIIFDKSSRFAKRVIKIIGSVVDICLVDSPDFVDKKRYEESYNHERFIKDLFILRKGNGLEGYLDDLNNWPIHGSIQIPELYYDIIFTFIGELDKSHLILPLRIENRYALNDPYLSSLIFAYLYNFIPVYSSDNFFSESIMITKISELSYPLTNSVKGKTSLEKLFEEPDFIDNYIKEISNVNTLIFKSIKGQEESHESGVQIFVGIAKFQYLELDVEYPIIFIR